MARPAPVNPAFLPPTHGVLKSLLENPVKLPLRHEGFGNKEKAKALDDEEEVGDAPQSAFLGPTLWDKTATVPYDGDNFQLEYMDLEEFLSENGISSSPAPTATTQQQHEHSHPNQNHHEHQNQNHHEHQNQNQNQHQHQQNQPSPTPLSNHHSQSTTVIASHSHSHSQAPAVAIQACHQNTAQTVLSCRSPASPADPESVSVCVSFEPDPADLALSSVPGQEVFDPRRRRFSEDELKPQPMIKKARKVFTPNDLKDDRYWARRRKNNMAAKRSRDARRLKENQIAIRASFLEKENSALRQEVAQLRKEVTCCRDVITRYQQQHTHTHTPL